MQRLRSGSKPSASDEPKGETADWERRGREGVGTEVSEAGGPHRVRSSVVEAQGLVMGEWCVLGGGMCVRTAVGRPVREAAVIAGAGGDSGLGHEP